MSAYRSCHSHILALDARQAHAERQPGDYDRTSWLVGYMAAVDDAAAVVVLLQRRALEAQKHQAPRPQQEGA